MEKFNISIDNELCLMERYKLTPTELFVVKIILLAQQENEYEWIQRFANVHSIRPIIEELQSKEIILKSWKLPPSGSKLVIEDIPFNKNFIKQFFRASFEMGRELFEIYPQTTSVNGQIFNLRRVSKKFDSLEDAFARYAKYIKYKEETHKQVLELVKWGIENGYTFTTLDSFIVDQDWNNLLNVKNGEIVNVNTDAIKMI